MLRACYKAGPTGYGLHRLLTSLEWAVRWWAPALIPRRAGDRVKTDKRDAARLARLLRAGELTAIRVPSPAEEAVRDLCRAWADLVDDRPRVRQRLKAFLLRCGRIYRDGSSWAAVTCGGWWCSGSAIRRWMSPSAVPGGAGGPRRRAGRGVRCGRSVLTRRAAAVHPKPGERERQNGAYPSTRRRPAQKLDRAVPYQAVVRETSSAGGGGAAAVRLSAVWKSIWCRGRGRSPFHTRAADAVSG